MTAVTLTLMANVVPARQFRQPSSRCCFRKMRAALGEAWTPQAIFFSHSAPLDARSHHRFFGLRVEFGCEIDGIVCLTRDLERANPTLTRPSRATSSSTSTRSPAARASP